ncbi:MAG: hypothetical protein ABSC94_33040 [Polyangiaceae bacterium]|jgi:hypothetical protein
MPASSSRVRAILQLVSELDEAERDELRDELDITETLNHAQWEHAWNGELSNRIEQIERGEAKLLTKDEFVTQLRAR